MGTYDLSANRALNVSFVNCTQTNDINDNTYWGILGSNFCKNLLYDHCTLSRFDAHQGVANATIRNSTLGHMGINAIGSGLLLVENSTIRGRSIVNLRPDYGSTWQGELVIRNCVFVPAGGKPVNCFSDQRILFRPARFRLHLATCRNGSRSKTSVSTIPGTLKITGARPFSPNFNPELTDNSYQEKYPYVKTKEVILRNVTTTSGKDGEGE